MLFYPLFCHFPSLQRWKNLHTIFCPSNLFELWILTVLLQFTKARIKIQFHISFRLCFGGAVFPFGEFLETRCFSFLLYGCFFLLRYKYRKYFLSPFKRTILHYPQIVISENKNRFREYKWEVLRTISLGIWLLNYIKIYVVVHYKYLLGHFK